jgi:hypothetical protein
MTAQIRPHATPDPMRRLTTAETPEPPAPPTRPLPDLPDEPVPMPAPTDPPLPEPGDPVTRRIGTESPGPTQTLG